LLLYAVNRDSVPHAIAKSWLERMLNGAEHWRVSKELLTESGAAGNPTTDAHLAAMAIENGCELCSADADFLRFSRLKRRNPLRSA